MKKIVYLTFFVFAACNQNANTAVQSASSSNVSSAFIPRNFCASAKASAFVDACEKVVVGDLPTSDAEKVDASLVKALFEQFDSLKPSSASSDARGDCSNFMDNVIALRQTLRPTDHGFLQQNSSLALCSFYQKASVQWPQDGSVSARSGSVSSSSRVNNVNNAQSSGSGDEGAEPITNTQRDGVQVTKKVDNDRACFITNNSGSAISVSSVTLFYNCDGTVLSKTQPLNQETVFNGNNREFSVNFDSLSCRNWFVDHCEAVFQ